MTEQGELKLENYKRKFRKRKIFLLGNARAGTSLIHKCLLITGLVNWGPWALDVYESEPKIRMIWTHYPNVNTILLKSKNVFEIAKSPDFDLVVDKLIELYPKSKFIVFERDLEERIKSFIGGFGNVLFENFQHYPNMVKLIKNILGKEPANNEEMVRGWLMLCEVTRESALKSYDSSLIFRIHFQELMDNWEREMKKLCEFIDIDYDFYKPIWQVMRTMKLRNTSSDVMKYVKN